MANEIRHIVFDIGSVLINWEPELAFLEQIPDARDRQWFLNNVCTTAWNLEQDRGRSWEEAEELLISDFPEHEDNIRTYRRNWSLMIHSEIPETVILLEALLSKQNDVTMLTNFACDTLEIARNRYEFLNSSRGITVSGDVRLLKPDIEIYSHHARAFDLSTGHTLFIDDSKKNVEGAINAGWNAVQFLDGKTLKADLERFHIDH